MAYVLEHRYLTVRVYNSGRDEAGHLALAQAIQDGWRIYSTRSGHHNTHFDLYRKAA